MHVTEWWVYHFLMLAGEFMYILYIMGTGYVNYYFLYSVVTHFEIWL